MKANSYSQFVTLPNLLSLVRAPLAFAFLSANVTLRLVVIFCAMLTDSIDGYLARRSKTASHFGALLDPATDKFFVFFAVSMFLFEAKLEIWQACALISRDFSLIFFALYLGISGHWSAFKCKALRWGKVSTALQFIVLMALTLGITIPSYAYIIFVLFGILAFIELFQLKQECKLKGTS